MTDEPLEVIRARLEKLEKEREDLIAWVRSRGYEPTDVIQLPNFDEQKRWNKYPALVKDIDNLRQRYISIQLASLNASSNRLEQATIRLGESTNAIAQASQRQLEATERVIRSSDRLNAVTDLLLVLTAVLAIGGIGTYTLSVATTNGLSGTSATYLTTAIVMIVVILIFLAAWRLRETRRRQLGQAV